MHPSMERLYAAALTLKRESGQSNVARLLNASPQTVKNWESRGISQNGAIKAQEIIGCNAAWVTEGTGVMTASNVEPAPMGGVRIPVISHVQAGIWTEVIDNFQPGDADDWLVTDLDVSGSTFALEIKGDSMLPEFKPGDRVIIDPDVIPQPGDYVVAKNGDEGATFKKYRPRGHGADGQPVFELAPLNDDFPTLRSDVEPVRIIGTMVEHRKYRRPR